MIDLSGRTAVVTGGSRGIGRAIALRLAAQGADVCLSYRGNAAAAAAVVADVEAHRPARPGECRPTPPTRPRTNALIEAALEAFGRIDILVNNAGHHPRRPHHAHEARGLGGRHRHQPLRAPSTPSRP